MSYFIIKAEFDLIQQPEWLVGFRAKYDWPYRFHITLKQKTTLKTGTEDLVCDALEECVHMWSPIEVVFSEYRTGKSPNGHCIMVDATTCQNLKELQKIIVAQFSAYGDIADASYASYEYNFQPHITIARRLNEQQFHEALDLITEKDLTSRALINSISIEFYRAVTVEDIHDSAYLQKEVALTG